MILAAIRTHPDHERRKRGRKPFEERIKEVRNTWCHLNDEEQLAKSWLALLTPVQDLAASNYGGRAIDNGVVWGGGEHLRNKPKIVRGRRVGIDIKAKGGRRRGINPLRPPGYPHAIPAVNTVR